MNKNYWFLLILSILVLGCNSEDTPSQISISWPTNNMFIKDSVTIKATVSDYENIKEVEFMIDGEVVDTIFESPFEFVWNSKQVKNGDHNLQCKSIDNSGNETLSEIIVVSVSNYLFKATFINNWVKDDEICILFLSDQNGTILAENTFSGNDSFEMYLDESLNLNYVDTITKINITTIVGTTDEGIIHLNSHIKTYLKIPVGSSWTWKNYLLNYKEIPDTVKLNFKNIPEHKEYLISNKIFGTYSFVTLKSLEDFPLDESPTNIYMCLNTVENGKKYLWLNDVVAGNRQVDLSNLKDASKKTIELQGIPTRCEIELSGIIETSKRYENSYWLDAYFQDNNKSSSIDLFYPESMFPEYTTKIYIKDNESPSSYWLQETHGEIPDKFIKLNADFEFVSTSYDNFEISASGEFLITLSQWKDINNNNYWDVYSDKTVLKYKLPNLPKLTTEQFGFNRESFTLIAVELIDHSNIKSFSEYTDINFSSDTYLYNVVDDYRFRQKSNIANSSIVSRDESQKRINNLISQNRYNGSCFIK